MTLPWNTTPNLFFFFFPGSHLVSAYSTLSLGLLTPEAVHSHFQSLSSTKQNRQKKPTSPQQKVLHVCPYPSLAAGLPVLCLPASQLLVSDLPIRLRLVQTQACWRKKDGSILFLPIKSTFDQLV